MTSLRVAALCLGLAVRAVAAPVDLRDAETIVFVGDSITEQHLWTSMVETYLLSRYPAKSLTFQNSGWGGDTARGGNARLDRDVLGLHPTLAIVAYGMNDGGYGAFDQWILDAYLPPLTSIVGRLKAAGARTLLVAPTPVDPHDDASRWLDGYNPTLERMGVELRTLAATLGVPSADPYPVLAAAIRAGASASPAQDSLVPDGIHPDIAGHLAMARGILAAFDPPPVVAELDLTAGRDPVDAALVLPVQPFRVPAEARRALPLVPFQRDLNRFTLRVTDWPANAPCHLAVDGRPVATLTADAVRAGVDLSLLDDSPWGRKGKALWELSQRRWRLRRQAWREFALEAPGEVRAAAGIPAWAAAQRDLIDALAADMRALVRPSSHVLRLSRAPLFGRVKGRLRVIEDWEDPTLGPGFPWDESVVAETATAFHTDGARSGRLVFDPAVASWASLGRELPAPQDLSGARRFAVDVLSDADGVSVGLEFAAGGDKKNRKKAEAAKVPAREKIRLVKGRTTIAVFTFPASAVLSAVSGWTLSLDYAKSGPPVTVSFDRLRLAD